MGKQPNVYWCTVRWWQPSFLFYFHFWTDIVSIRNPASFSGFYHLFFSFTSNLWTPFTACDQCQVLCSSEKLYFKPERLPCIILVSYHVTFKMCFSWNYCQIGVAVAKADLWINKQQDSSCYEQAICVHVLQIFQRKKISEISLEIYIED